MWLGWGEGGGVVGVGSHLSRSFWCAFLAMMPLALGGCDSGGGEGAEGETKTAPKTLLRQSGFGGR